MALTSIKHYVVDANKISIPDKGLGGYVMGFTEENKLFNWANIWWILLPGAGWLFIIGHILRHWWVKSHPDRILLYRKGFIKQSLDSKGRVKKASVINFDEIKGLLYGKTRRYQVIYGIRSYSGTSVNLSILGTNNVKENIITGMYRNENEIDGKYNFVGYACNAISNSWTQFAIDKFNGEFSAKGYGTFATNSGEILVGKDFIKANGIIVSSGFKYSFDNGWLYLYPNAAESIHFKQRSKPVAINVAEMYNKEVFLMAINQLHGIK